MYFSKSIVIIIPVRVTFCNNHTVAGMITIQILQDNKNTRAKILEIRNLKTDYLKRVAPLLFYKVPVLEVR